MNVELELLNNDMSIPANIESTDTTLSLEVENENEALELSINETQEDIDISFNETNEDINLEHEKVVVVEAEAGGYYTPKAEQIDSDTVRISFTPSKGTMTPVTPTDLTILKGEKGEDGYTPQKGVDYFDGKDGTDGYTPQKNIDYFDGDDGKDGVSASHSWDGTTLTITSASGTSSADLKGEMGLPGRDGVDGKTPEKGVDYFTSVDITEIVRIVKAEVLNENHPVGSLYYSKNPTDPSTLFGGTWERVKDTFILAAGDTYAVGTTGGEATHTTTIDEMPNHRHSTYGLGVDSSSLNANANYAYATMRGVNRSNHLNTTEYTAYEGGGKAHNNMPPYKAYYCWERIA